MSSLLSLAMVMACSMALVLGQSQSGMSTGKQTCSCRNECTAQGVATYNVVFDFTWPSSNYRIPVGPHWSPPVFVTHTPCAVVWRDGVIATSGLELLAETGQVSRQGGSSIQAEVSALGDQSYTFQVGGLVNSATGQQSRVVSADNKRFVLSALSMIAPSPDWFVGVDSVPLCVNNTFIDTATYNLYPMDSGSDSGTTYRAGNQDQSPKIPVFRIFPSNGTDVFATGGVASVPMGTLTITRTAIDTTASSPASVVCSECASDVQCRTGTQTPSPVQPTTATATSVPLTTNGPTVTTTSEARTTESPTVDSATSESMSTATRAPGGLLDSTSASGALVVSVLSVLLSAMACLLLA